MKNRSDIEKTLEAKTMQLSKRVRPTIIEYIAGGLLGNVPLILTIFFLTFFDPMFLNSIFFLTQVVIFGSVVGGAALAAFYVTVGVQSRHIARVLTVGLVTGAFCYIINIVFSVFLFPWLPLGEYLRIAAFLPGSVLGAIIRTMRTQPIRRAPSSPKA